MTIDLCYIAGPMTGIERFNFPAFDAARDALMDQGWHVISPADMDRRDGFDETACTGYESLTIEQRRRFARNDVGAILTVDAVFVLPGWDKSTGARNEVMVAGWLGVPVFTWPDKAAVDATAVWSGV